jgi:transcriptional regulator with XRE-family HTH domain
MVKYRHTRGTLVARRFVMATLPRLREVRELRALSQRDLSKLAGVSRVTIARLEAGGDDPYPRTVRKLATALNVDPATLMGKAAPETERAA